MNGWIILCNLTACTWNKAMCHFSPKWTYTKVNISALLRIRPAPWKFSLHDLIVKGAGLTNLTVYRWDPWWSTESIFKTSFFVCVWISFRFSLRYSWRLILLIRTLYCSEHRHLCARPLLVVHSLNQRMTHDDATFLLPAPAVARNVFVGVAVTLLNELLPWLWCACAVLVRGSPQLFARRNDRVWIRSRRWQR